MTIQLGVLMDPISQIKRHKDSTFAMLLEGQRRGWPLWYLEMGDLYLKDGRSHARMRRLSVEDEGTGIPEVIREKIFTPYFTTKPDGNGVGLAMVSKVVKIHGGQILLDSEVGRGSRFTAVMPGRVVEV